MVKMDMKPLTNEDIQGLIFEILNDKQKRLFIDNWELDCSYTVEGLARFRCNVFMQRKGMGAVFRMIPEKIRTFDELGLPKEIRDLVAAERGLVCVTGPTGSGKSTTLAAIINYINQTRQGHIITIEDPIEFVHTNINCLINQREVSSHTKSFANALKASLREDPDIILLGEMRDLETIQLAMTAAETGHLVFGTLHTSSAHKTVDRIIDVFPDTQQEQVRVQLAESLRGVIAQILLPKATEAGRVASFEIMANTKAIANMIREGKTFQIPSAMQTMRSSGAITMESYVGGLIQKGLITRETGYLALGHVGPSKANEESGSEAKETTAPNAGAHAPAQPAKSASTPANPAAKPEPTANQKPPAGAPPTPPTTALGSLANRFKKTS